MTKSQTDNETIDDTDPRRDFLKTATTVAMTGGLAAGYGAFAYCAGRFLFPASGEADAWQFVATLDDLAQGAAIEYESPSGVKVVVARQSDGDTPDDFIALSSVCPHLGCAVHWEPQNDRFFCPCHNGAFDARGMATEGPPATANQQLARFPLKVEAGLLFILAPTQSVTRDPWEA